MGMVHFKGNMPKEVKIFKIGVERGVTNGLIGGEEPGEEGKSPRPIERERRRREIERPVIYPASGRWRRRRWRRWNGEVGKCGINHTEKGCDISSMSQTLRCEENNLCERPLRAKTKARDDSNRRAMSAIGRVRLKLRPARCKLHLYWNLSQSKLGNQFDLIVRNA